MGARREGQERKGNNKLEGKIIKYGKKEERNREQ